MSTRRKPYSLLLLAFLSFCYTSQAGIINSVKDGSWSDPTVWDMGVPGPTDTVVIDGHLIEALDLTISVARVELTNDVGTAAQLTLQGTTFFEVAGEFYVRGEGRSADLSLQLEDNSQLEVNGLLNIHRLSSNSDNNIVQLVLINNAKVYAKNGFTFDYHSSGTGESNHEIVLYNDALLDVTGPTQFYNRTGKEFSVATYWTTDIILRNDFTAQLTTGEAMFFEANSFSDFTVKGDTYITNDAGTGDIDFVLNTSGDFHFEGNLDLTANLAGKKIWFTANDIQPNLHVGKDIIFNTIFDATIGITLNSFTDLYIGGNFVRTNGYGKLNMSDNAVLYLNGSDVQTIPTAAGVGNDSIKISNLNINSTADSLILEGPLYISNNLELVDGVIVTSTANPIIIDDQVDITGGSKDAYIDGPITKNGRNNGGTFTFPVGDDGIYAPITTSVVSNAASAYTVQYLRTTPPSGTLVGGLSAVSALEYWVFDSAPGSETVNITLAWDNATTSSIQDTSQLVMSRHDEGSGEWVNIGVSQITGGDAPGQAGTITHDLGCPPPCCHSILTFGTLTPDNILPLDLQSFSAKLQGDDVLLNWTTSDEIDMEKFEIERSTDGINFQSILETPSKGQLGFYIYQSRDETLNRGYNYYRLKMIDFQDMITYSQVVSVYFETIYEWKAFPNPVSDHFQLEGTEEIVGDTQIEVFNQMGQKVYTGLHNLEAQTPGLSSSQLNMELPGLYRIYFNQAGKIATATVTIIKE